MSNEKQTSEQQQGHAPLAGVSHRRVLLDFIDWWNNLPDEHDDKIYMTEETIDKFLKSNCG